MTLIMNRRRFVGTVLSAAALGGLGGLSSLPLIGRSTARAATPTRLAVERRTIEVKGQAATVFRIGTPDGRTGLTLEPGARFLVELENRLTESTLIHWHGQTPPDTQDGIALGDQRPLRPGERRLYDFEARAGTHWMHSHVGFQEQHLLAAPLIVHGADDLRADVQDVVVLLHDFTTRDAAEIAATLASGAGHGGHGGHGGHEGHGGHGGHGDVMMPDLNDVEYDAYLANDRTLDDPEVVAVERRGRVRLRLINGASSTAFLIDLGMLDGTVIATDGNPVRPVSGRRFGMTMGQRLDILIDLPDETGAWPILAQREGDRIRTGIILATPGAAVARIAEDADRPAEPLDLTLEALLSASTPLAPRATDTSVPIVLGGTMAPYAWSLNEAFWGDHRRIAVEPGARVALEFINRSMMAHPMHLHGHHFQVVAIDGRPVSGAMRDTVLVPPNRTVTVAFDADNPGRWLLHCHHLYHMATGMMTELAYGSAG